MSENKSQTEGPTITFGPSAAETVLQEFGALSVDDDGFVCEDGERLTDGYGTPIKAKEASVVDFEAEGFSINDNGFVIDDEGLRITAEYDEGGTPSQEALIPFTNKEGVKLALLRDNFVCICDYVAAKEGVGHRRMD